MIGVLYRYPHPHDSSKFIYVGQGPNRDKDHRSSRSPFGKRFFKKYLNTELPQPIKEEIEVSNQTELNEEETIWMFRYHTWKGYLDGENKSLPGSDDYKRMGALGCSLGGQIQGAVHAKNRTGVCGRSPENILEDARKGGIQVNIIHPNQASENGYKSHRLYPDLAFRRGKLGGAKTASIPGHMAKAGRIGGRVGGRIGGKISACLQWVVRRGKACVCGKHVVNEVKN